MPRSRGFARSSKRPGPRPARDARLVALGERLIAAYARPASRRTGRRALIHDASPPAPRDPGGAPHGSAPRCASRVRSRRRGSSSCRVSFCCAAVGSCSRRAGSAWPAPRRGCFATGIARDRLARGEPWMRMAVILGAVAALNLLAAALLARPAAGAAVSKRTRTAVASAGRVSLDVRPPARHSLEGRGRSAPPRAVSPRRLLAGSGRALVYAALIAEWLQDDVRVPRVRFVLWSVFSAALLPAARPGAAPAWSAAS